MWEAELNNQESIIEKQNISKINTIIWVLKSNNLIWENDTPKAHFIYDENDIKKPAIVIAVDSDDDGDIDYYFKNNVTVDLIISINKLRNHKYYLKAQDLANYVEMPWKKWKFEVYKREDKSFKEPIKVNDFEYYKAQMEILFYAVRLGINDWVGMAERNKIVTLSKEIITIFLDSGSLRIDDILLFKEKWWITQEIYDYTLPQIVKILPQQCSDTRFDRALRSGDK